MSWILLSCEKHESFSVDTVDHDNRQPFYSRQSMLVGQSACEPIQHHLIQLLDDSQWRYFNFGRYNCFCPIHQQIWSCSDLCSDIRSVTQQSIWQHLVPTSAIFNHLPQNLLYVLVGGFYSSVHLGTIGGGISVSNLELFTYLSHQVTVKIRSVISNDGFWYSKPTYHVVANKISYNFLGYRLVRAASTHLVK